MEQVGFVYFMVMYDDRDESDHGWCHIKIGYSARPHERLASLQTATPFAIDLQQIFPGSKEDERALHQRFAAHKLNREWFRYADEIDELIYDLLDARLLLRRKHGERYDPSIRECMAVEGATEAIDDMIGSATPEQIDWPLVPFPA